MFDVTVARRLRAVGRTILLCCIVLAGCAAGWAGGRSARAQEAADPPNGSADAELDILRGILTRPESTPANRQDAASLLLKRSSEASVEILRDAIKRASQPQVPLAVARAIAASREPVPPELLPSLYELAAAEELPAELREALPAAVAAYLHTADRMAAHVERIRDSESPTHTVVLVRALGRTGEKAAVESLIELLRSERPGVRSVAAEALRRITLTDGFGESYEGWSKWWAEHEDEPREQWLEQRLLAVESLVKQHREQTEQLIRRLVEAQRERLDALASEQRRAEVLRLLDDPLPAVRGLAAVEARRLLSADSQGADALVEKLAERVDDPDPAVRQEVVAALAAAGRPQIGQLLLDRLDDESAPTVRLAILQALGDLREPAAVPALIDLLDAEDEPLTVAAAEALGQIGQRGTPSSEAVMPAIEPLTDLLSTGEQAASPAVRQAVARALSQIAPPQALEPLIRAMDDPTPMVRFYAAQAIGNLEDGSGDRATDPLLKHLSDSNKGVRVAVADALGKKGGTRAAEAIANRLSPTSDESDPEVRSGLWNALLAIERRQGDPKQIEAFGDRFAASESAADIAGAVQLYELARSKFDPGQGNGNIFRLTMKIAEGYSRTGQPNKAAAELRELMSSVRDPDEQARVAERLGRVLLRVPPHVEGTELLAEQAKVADQGARRDDLVRAIYDQAATLLNEGHPAEAYAVMSKARQVLSGDWVGSAEADRMETLLLRSRRALFDTLVEHLGDDQAEADPRALQQATALIGRDPDLLLRRLKSALEAGDDKRIARLEKLLPALDWDVSAYLDAGAHEAKLEVLASWSESAARPQP